MNTLALVGLGAAMIAMVAVPVRAMPLCYAVGGSGQVIDLTSMCGSSKGAQMVTTASSPTRYVSLGKTASGYEYYLDTESVRENSFTLVKLADGSVVKTLKLEMNCQRATFDFGNYNSDVMPEVGSVGQMALDKACKQVGYSRYR